MAEPQKRSRVVGEFIKNRREAMNISQRALGQYFTPPVTTQFISNIERGVTPLPPMHIPVIAKALSVNESEILTLLEREYALKLNGRLGRVEGDGLLRPSHSHGLQVSEGDFDFFKGVYEAYQMADDKSRDAFKAACENVLKVRRTSLPQ